jgi:hypothetical protein
VLLLSGRCEVTDEERETTHHFEYALRKGQLNPPFARLQLVCPYCEGEFWVEADQFGEVSNASHRCAGGTWEME